MSATRAELRAAAWRTILYGQPHEADLTTPGALAGALALLATLDAEEGGDAGAASVVAEVLPMLAVETSSDGRRWSLVWPGQKRVTP